MEDKKIKIKQDVSTKNENLLDFFVTISIIDILL